MSEKYNIPESNSLDSMEGIDPINTQTENLPDSLEGKIIKTRIIENEQLGVSFEETMIELPQYRQEETGIKRIIKRSLVKSPDFFNGNSQDVGYEYSDKTKEIWNFITDNKISQGTKLGHVVAWHATTDNEEKRERGVKQLDQHIQDGFYFGKVLPENISDYGKDFDKNIEVSDLFTTVGDYVWTDRISTPVYFFGTENVAFRDYLKSILNNEDILSVIKNRWEKRGGKDSGTVIYPGSSEFDEEFNESIDRNFDIGEEVVAKIERQKKICSERSIPLFTGLRCRNISFLKILSDGIDTACVNPFAEATIPSVHSVEVRSLRWCHSDLAIMPTKKSLSILFFASE